MTIELTTEELKALKELLQITDNEAYDSIYNKIIKYEIDKDKH